MIDSGQYPPSNLVTTMLPLTAEILEQLQSVASEEKRRVLMRFFKTGKGEYGEGDCFLGVVVPLTRRVVKQYRDAPMEVVEELLASPWHECRLCALLILVDQYQRADRLRRKDASTAEERCDRIYQFYLAHTPSINNWDLVDLSAPYIIGVHLLHHPRTLLTTLAHSPNLWEQRIAVVATLGLIRQGEYTETYRLAEYFAAPERQPLHDLMQKAVGWMLREVGKRDRELLRRFLEQEAASMPRTMLRYAIEKLPEQERLYWMGRKEARERFEA
jgi:3-methyladenine DNA glycosylase AlkD